MPPGTVTRGAPLCPVEPVFGTSRSTPGGVTEKEKEDAPGVMCATTFQRFAEVPTEGGDPIVVFP